MGDIAVSFQHPLAKIVSCDRSLVNESLDVPQFVPDKAADLDIRQLIAVSAAPDC